MSLDNPQGSKKPTGCVTPASPCENHEMRDDQVCQVQTNVDIMDGHIINNTS